MKVSVMVSVLTIGFTGFATAGEIDLDWLAGAWCAESEQRSAEEHWMRAKEGLMLGMSRTVTKRGMEFEFVRIELAANGARFIALPSGQTETSFDLAELGTNAVTFENPQHDFPKRVRYWREGDRLFARIDAGEGSSKASEFQWQKCVGVEADSG